MSGTDPVAVVLDDIRHLRRPFRLTGRVQAYAWGGHTFLRNLTGLDLPRDRPAAEWWLGAHPSATSVITTTHGACGLDAAIASSPAALLGPDVAARFGGRLPYLLKVLDVRQMLSIQAHPSKRQAEEGFARENRAGVPPDASHRNYRDDNHKPEAQVALTPFWMLAGFRTEADIARTLAERPALAPLARAFDRAKAEPIRTLYRHIMTMDADAVDRIVDEIATRARTLEAAGGLERSSPDFWALRAATDMRRPNGHHDAGVLAIYLLNLIYLEPGRASFLGAGVLHAYLEGACVEIMANSDNVIRGGLTPKHVDVDELMSVVSFHPSGPTPLEPTRIGGAQALSMPIDEFALDRWQLPAGQTAEVAEVGGPAILVAIDGEAELLASGGVLSLARGQAAFAAPDVAMTLRARTAVDVFRARVPQALAVGVGQ